MGCVDIRGQDGKYERDGVRRVVWRTEGTGVDHGSALHTTILVLRRHTRTSGAFASGRSDPWEAHGSGRMGEDVRCTCMSPTLPQPSAPAASASSTHPARTKHARLVLEPRGFYLVASLTAPSCGTGSYGGVGRVFVQVPNGFTRGAPLDGSA